MYVPLWCKSNFSFLEGASHPEELVERAHTLGLPALAITDRDGVYGIVRAHVKAQELGVKLLVGAEVTLTDGATLLLLARDRTGYGHLTTLLTKGHLRSSKGTSAVAWSEVVEHAEGLLALLGSGRCVLHGDADPHGVLAPLREAFEDRLYALLARHTSAGDDAREERVRWRADALGIPTVAATEVLYHVTARRPLQDVLAATRHRTKLATAGRLLRPNAEHDLKTPHTFQARFADDPTSVARTLEVAERCTFQLDEIRYRYPSERLPSGKTSLEWLRELAHAGALQRYGTPSPAVLQQIDRELEVIRDLDYAGYFLTMWEIVSYCRAHDILCQGRGSAANSAVCYCLGITAVDPVRMELLFERFLSRERAEPPDIDLDIEHERREEVIQHVYEKYGRSHAAMVANVIRYRPKSALRDVGKALGIPETALGRASKLLSHWGQVDEGALAASGLGCSPRTFQHLVRLVNEIQGFPRHLSIHPGGFLLGHEPVHTLVPIENGAMEKRTVIQWDKDDIEALGLFKVDLLGLGALSHMHRCFDLLRAHRSIDLDMARVPKEDAATFEMIGRGDTVGVFQIESRAQMSMLPRLKPKTYYDLVIEVSIVRPGPITGGMVHPYLRRRNGEEPVAYPHPCLEPVLRRTLGVPLFQEQVMRLAVVAADYTPGEADQLRRDMAAWRRTGRIEQHRERLISRMERKGIAPEFAERVFKQICGFGDYGFPESHAASFALVAYAGAWMKCHHPEVFVCALLNSLPMGFYAPHTLVEDAKRHGVVFLPVDVSTSRWDCTLVPTSGGDRGVGHPPLAVRMGARFVNGLSETGWRRVEEARLLRPFASVVDAVERTRLTERQQRALAEAGAFHGLEPSRRRALWTVTGRTRDAPPPLALDPRDTTEFPALTAAERMGWDYAQKAHSTEGHLLTPLRPRLQHLGLPDARSIAAMKHGTRVRYAGLVICRQHPATAAGVTFMTLEDETGFVNLVLWKDVFRTHGVVARTASVLGVTGRLQVNDGVTHLVAEALWLPDLGEAPPAVGSRDFR